MSILASEDLILHYNFYDSSIFAEDKIKNSAIQPGQEDIIEDIGDFSETFEGTLTNLSIEDFISSSPINNGAINFTSNKRVLSAASPVELSGYEYSWSFWAKLQANLGYRALFHLNSTTTSLAFLVNNNIPYWSTNGAAATNPFNGASLASYIGNWHHFTISQDSNGALLYIDGELIGEAGAQERSFTSVCVGNTPSGDRSAAGYLTDFRFYKKALTPSEVIELYSLRFFPDVDGNLYGVEVTESDDNLVGMTDIGIAAALDDTSSLVTKVSGDLTFSYSNGIYLSDGSVNKCTVTQLPGRINLIASGVTGKGGFIWEPAKNQNGNLFVDGRSYAIVFDMGGSISSIPDIYGFFPSLAAASGSQYALDPFITSGSNLNKIFVFTATPTIIETSKFFIIGWSELSGKTINSFITTIQLYDLTGRALTPSLIKSLQGTSFVEGDAIGTGVIGVETFNNGITITNKLYEN